MAVTREVVELAHERGVSVEGELGVLGSLETGMGDQEDGHGAEGVLDREQLITDPEQAEDFVARTGVDALAVAIGTSHGAYKFSHKPDAGVLVMDCIREIHRRLPDTHIVMHGSSSVPQRLQDIFNAYGGEMRQTWGVPVEEIQEGIRHGVRKINVDTDNRLAMTGAVRRVLTERRGEFDPRQYLTPAREAMADVCAARMEAFGMGGPGGRRAGGIGGRDGAPIRRAAARRQRPLAQRRQPARPARRRDRRLGRCPCPCGRRSWT